MVSDECTLVRERQTRAEGRVRHRVRDTEQQECKSDSDDRVELMEGKGSQQAMHRIICPRVDPG